MRNRPYFNGIRSIIRCPVCSCMFVNRKYKSCPRCKVGLKFAGEFIFEKDWYWDNGKWISYKELEAKITT